MQAFTLTSNIRPISDKETDYMNVPTRGSCLKCRFIPPSWPGVSVMEGFETLTLTFDIRVCPCNKKILHQLLIPFICCKLKKSDKFSTCNELVRARFVPAAREAYHQSGYLDELPALLGLENHNSRMCLFEWHPEKSPRTAAGPPPLHLVLTFLLLANLLSNIIDRCRKISEGDNEKK